MIVTDEEVRSQPDPRETMKLIMYRTVIAKGMMTDVGLFDFTPDRLTPREQFLIATLSQLAEDLVYAATRKPVH